MISRLLFCLVFIGIFSLAQSATVDTVSIYSNSMNKWIKCAVVKPKFYKKKKKHFPVVYVLHGYGGDFRNWLMKVPELMAHADTYQCLIVTPDGAKNSWYFNSPLKDSFRYQTFIASEVPRYIDSAYRTMRSREHRAITGLSMGGHGALYLAWKHPEMFGAAGSMSGGVDLTESRNRFEIEKLLGPWDKSGEWKAYSMIYVAETKPSLPLQLLIDCGVDDFFIEGNRKLHNALLSQKIPHEYLERPGAHSWDYWRNAIDYHLLFFNKFFKKTH